MATSVSWRPTARGEARRRSGHSGGVTKVERRGPDDELVRPHRRFEQGSGWLWTVTRPQPAFRRVVPSFRVSIPEPLAPILGSAPPSCPHPCGRTPRSSRSEVLGICKQSRGSSRGLTLSFKDRTRNRAASLYPRRSGSQRPAPSSRFHAPTALASPGSGIVGGLPTARQPAPSGFLNLLAPSSARSVPALFHASCAHGVHPSELCSSRAGDSRFRCRALLPSDRIVRPRNFGR